MGLDGGGVVMIMAVLMITVGHRTFSDQLRHLTNQSCTCMDDTDSSIEGVPIGQIAKKEKELATATWLSYERLDRDNGAALKCKVCAQ